jgi:hypothetical protein
MEFTTLKVSTDLLHMEPVQCQVGINSIPIA